MHHDLIGGGVDLGHASLAPVEQGDDLADDCGRVVVGGREIVAPIPKLGDLGLEVSHGGEGSRARPPGRSHQGPVPSRRAAPEVTATTTLKPSDCAAWTPTRRRPWGGRRAAVEGEGAPHERIRIRRLAALSLGAMAFAACGSGSDQVRVANVGATIVVGSAPFAESVIVAYMYAGALQQEGYQVTVRRRLGQREVYLPALEIGGAENGIDLVPEYVGSMLEHLNGNAGEATSDLDSTVAKLRTRLDPTGLTVLNPSPATDKKAFAVTRATAERLNLTKLSDLGRRWPANSPSAQTPPARRRRPASRGSRPHTERGSNPSDRSTSAASRPWRRSPRATSTWARSSPATVLWQLAIWSCSTTTGGCNWSTTSSPPSGRISSTTRSPPSSTGCRTR